MKKTQNNLYCFKISQKNQEKTWDDFYVFEEKHPRLK